MSARGTRRAWATALVVAWAIGGCDYFKAAQPEAPILGGFTPSYVSPEATLQTVADALADKARTVGLTAYVDAFADSTSASTPAFHQFFWSTDAAAWEAAGHTVPDWTIKEEKNFYIKFVNLQPQAYELEWLPDQDLPDDPLSADVAHWHRHYLVRTLDEAGNATSIQARCESGDRNRCHSGLLKLLAADLGLGLSGCLGEERIVKLLVDRSRCVGLGQLGIIHHFQQRLGFLCI